MGIVGQIVDFQGLQVWVSCPTVRTCIDGIVDWRAHYGVIGTSFVTGQGWQGKRVTQSWGVRWGSNRTQIVRHDSWETSRQAEGGRGRVVQQDVLLEVSLTRQRYLTQVAETGGRVVALG